MSSRRCLAGLAVAVALTTAGCYGSTEPATDVTEDSAVLRAQGTASNGPAWSYFEYAASDLGNLSYTPRRSWPAGARGPIGERVSDLLAASQYTFRLCGDDEGGHRYSCAQKRTFKTATPSGDFVSGEFLFYVRASTVYGRFNVRSSLASGAQPRGDVRVPLPPLDPLITGHPIEWFYGSATCLAVNSDRAVIGVVDDAKEFLQLTVEGGGARYGFERLGPTPVNCEQPRPESEFFSPPGSAVAVRDVS